MGLLEEAKGMEHRMGGTCGIQTLLSRLSPSEQAELLEALASPVHSKAIAKALQARGHTDIGYHTIARHRREDCKCRS